MDAYVQYQECAISSLHPFRRMSMNIRVVLDVSYIEIDMAITAPYHTFSFSEQNISKGHCEISCSHSHLHGG